MKNGLYLACFLTICIFLEAGLQVSDLTVHFQAFTLGQVKIYVWRWQSCGILRRVVCRNKSTFQIYLLTYCPHCNGA
jgi:hypothetical protein